MQGTADQMLGDIVPNQITRIVSPAPRVEWRRLYEIDPMATLSQGPEWTDALCTFTSWKDASRYYETSDGHSFVLPLVERGIGSLGRQLSSLPAGWGMGGLVGSRPITSDDVSAIIEDMRNLRGIGFRILPNPLGGDAWMPGVGDRAMTLPRYSHVLDLEGGFEKVSTERFRRTARKVVRRAKEGTLDIETDTTGRLIPVYRDLFQRSVERWAARSHEPLWLARIRGNREDPAGKLEFLAETLGDQMTTWVAWYRGEAAAADITLGGNSVFAWRGAMHEELGPETNAAYLLQNVTIEASCEAGAAYYYLGESGQSSGMALFKERFGGVGYPYPEVRFERLPITRADRAVRGVVKRLVGYRTS